MSALKVSLRGPLLWAGGLIAPFWNVLNIGNVFTTLEMHQSSEKRGGLDDDAICADSHKQGAFNGELQLRTIICYGH